MISKARAIGVLGTFAIVAIAGCGTGTTAQPGTRPASTGTGHAASAVIGNWTDLPACASIDVSSVRAFGAGWDTRADNWNYADNGSGPEGWARGCSVGRWVKNAAGNQIVAAAVTMILRRRTDPEELRKFMNDPFPRGLLPAERDRAETLPGIGDQAKGLANASPLDVLARPYFLWAHRGPDTVILTVEIYQNDVPVQPSDARQALTQIAHSMLAT